jgi:hypothetical protein
MADKIKVEIDADQLKVVPPDTEKPPAQASEPATSEGEAGKQEGYTVADILEAPVKPPSPDVSGRAKADTKDAKTRFLIVMGLVLAAVGVALFFIVDPVFGFVIGLLGALLAGAAVFLPPKK